MLSVIIPTCNRSQSLELALTSVCKQTLSANEFEILILDNGSSDNTKKVADNFMRDYPGHSIRYIYEPEPGLLSGRHRGALEAKGDILVFVDDDIEATEGWLQAIKDTFNDPAVQLVGGRNLPKYEVEPPDWLRWFWQRHPYGRICCELSLLDFGEETREIDANYVWGLNFSIRKSALFELGGFHPDCIPKHLQHFQGDGETGLTMKANERAYRAIYQPKALVYHHIPASRMTYEYFDKRYFYQGVCNSFTEIRKKNSKYRTKKLEVYLKEIEVALGIIEQKVKSIFTEKEKLKYRFNQSLINGYRFHQEAVKKNPKLLKWVLRDNYWDYKLPDIGLDKGSFLEAID